MTARVETGQDTVIVSTLVLLEVMHVIRKRVTEKENYIGLSPGITQQIQTKAETKVKEFIDKTTRLAAQGKAVIVDPDDTLTDYLGKALSIFRPHFGNIDHSDSCPVCHRSLHHRYRYRGLGHYDIQHAINARDCQGAEIHSFDHAFSQLSSIPDFSQLKTYVH